MRRCLVVANQTLGGERLHEEIRRRIRDGPCRFHVVVPIAGSVPEREAGPETLAVAERQLESVLSRLHGMGILATGEVSDDPDVAVAAAQSRDHFDEVILPTLPV